MLQGKILGAFFICQLLIINFGPMKRIKTRDIDPSKLITKAEFARRQGVSQTEIDRRIKAGMFTIIVTLDGKELIHL